MNVLHTITMSVLGTVSSESANNRIFLVCGAVAGTFRGTGGVVLRLAGGLFFAPELFEIGGCEGASELYIW